MDGGWLYVSAHCYFLSWQFSLLKVDGVSQCNTQEGFISRRWKAKGCDSRLRGEETKRQSEPEVEIKGDKQHRIYRSLSIYISTYI